MAMMILTTQPIKMIQLNTNHSNIVCHALLNDAIREYDILLVTEPWYGDIGNNTKGQYR